MTRDKLAIVALKVMGIYFLAATLISSPSILTAVELSMEGDTGQNATLLATTSVFLVFGVLVGYLLAFKTEVITNWLFKHKEHERIEIKAINLAEIIQLMGLFILATSLGDLFLEMIHGYYTETESFLKMSFILPDMISVLISMVFILKAQWISDLLTSLRNQ